MEEGVRSGEHERALLIGSVAAGRISLSGHWAAASRGSTVLLEASLRLQVFGDGS